jgi:GxxExxY protein
MNVFKFNYKLKQKKPMRNSPEMETNHIIEIATKIMQDLGSGYSESIYQNALHRKIARIDCTCIMEKSIPVVYDGEYIGVCRADLVMDSHVIEIKAARKMPTGVDKQVGKYSRHLLELDGKARVGLVINFNQDTEIAETLIFPAPSLQTDALPKRRKITPMDDSM